MSEVKPKTAKQHNIEQGVVGIDNKTLVFNEGSSRAEQWVMIQVEKIKAEARLSTAREIFEEIICPMCYRLNPQHAPSGDYKGCHNCQEKEKWCGQSRFPETTKPQ